MERLQRTRQPGSPDPDASTGTSSTPATTQLVDANPPIAGPSTIGNPTGTTATGEPDDQPDDEPVRITIVVRGSEVSIDEDRVEVLLLRSP